MTLSKPPFFHDQFTISTFCAACSSREGGGGAEGVDDAGLDVDELCEFPPTIAPMIASTIRIRHPLEKHPISLFFFSGGAET
jgi:hypothetical protein